MIDPLVWLLLSVVGVVSALWTMIQRHRATPPVIPGKSAVEVQAEEKARKDDQAAVEQHDADVARAKADAEKAAADVVERLEKDKDKLLVDNDALTDHLKNVGKGIRGG